MKEQGKACQADPILCRVSYVEAAQLGLAWCQTTAGVFTHTLGQGGPTKRCRRPMVLKRRYVRERLASECTTKGLRCMKGRRSTCTGQVQVRQSAWEHRTLGRQAVSDATIFRKAANMAQAGRHKAGAEGAHTPHLWPSATCTGASKHLGLRVCNTLTVDGCVVQLGCTRT